MDNVLKNVTFTGDFVPSEKTITEIYETIRKQIVSTLTIDNLRRDELYSVLCNMNSEEFFRMLEVVIPRYVENLNSSETFGYIVKGLNSINTILAEDFFKLPPI